MYIYQYHSLDYIMIHIIYYYNISKTLAKKLNNNSLRIQIHRLLNLAHKQLKPSIIKNLMLPVILINQQ